MVGKIGKQKDNIRGFSIFLIILQPNFAILLISCSYFTNFTKSFLFFLLKSKVTEICKLSILLINLTDDF